MRRRFHISDMLQIRISEAGVGSEPLSLALGVEGGNLSGLARIMTRSALLSGVPTTVGDLHTMLNDPLLAENVLVQILGRADRNIYAQNPVMSAELFTNKVLTQVGAIYGAASPDAVFAYLGILYHHLSMVFPKLITGKMNLVVGVEQNLNLVPSYEDLLVAVVRARLGSAFAQAPQEVASLIGAIASAGRPQVTAIVSVVHPLNKVLAHQLTRLIEVEKQLGMIMAEVLRSTLSEATPAADAASNGKFTMLRNDWSIIAAALDNPSKLRFVGADAGFAFDKAVNEISDSLASPLSRTRSVSRSEYRSYFRVMKKYDPLLNVATWVEVSRAIDLRATLPAATTFITKSALSSGASRTLSVMESLRTEAVTASAFRDLPSLWSQVVGPEMRAELVETAVGRLTSPLLPWTTMVADLEAWTLVVSHASGLQFYSSGVDDDPQVPDVLHNSGARVPMAIGALSGNPEEAVALIRDLRMEAFSELDVGWHPTTAAVYADRIDNNRFYTTSPLVFHALAVPLPGSPGVYPLSAGRLLERLEQAGKGVSVLSIPGAVPTDKSWRSRIKSKIRIPSGAAQYEAQMEIHDFLGNTMIVLPQLELLLVPEARLAMDESLRLLRIIATVAAADPAATEITTVAWLMNMKSAIKHDLVISVASQIRPTLALVTPTGDLAVTVLDTRRAEDATLLVSLRFAVLRELIAVLLGNKNIVMWRDIERTLDVPTVLARFASTIFLDV